MHTLESLLDRTVEIGDCREWTGAGDVPHVRVAGEVVPVRRLILRLAEIDIRPGYVVGNTCRNPKCVEPSHIVIRSPKQHARIGHKRRNQQLINRKIAATKRAKSKFTPELVAEIRASTESGRVLAERLGMNRRSVYRIRSGQRWADTSSPWMGLGARA